MNRQDLQERAGKLRAQQMATPCRVLICCSTPCLSSGAKEVKAAFEESAAAYGNKVSIEVTATGCLGPCSRGPLVTVQRPGHSDRIYERVTPELAGAILAALAGVNIFNSLCQEDHFISS